MSSVKKERDYIFNYSYNDVFNAIADAARLCNMTVNVQDINKGYIFLSTSISLLSYGENIDIYLRPVSPTSTSMHIISDSTLSTTLVDWGVNNKNINKIIEGTNTLLYNHYNR